MPDNAKVITTFGRFRAALYSAVLFGAFCGFLWMLFNGEPTTHFSRYQILFVAITGLAITGTGFIACVVQCWRPSRLVLSPAGFQLEWIWPLPLIRWSDVERFDLVSQGLVKHVGFRLTPSASATVGRAWWRMAASENFDATLFSGMSKKPTLVLDELRDWHRRYGI